MDKTVLYALKTVNSMHFLSGAIKAQLITPWSLLGKKVSSFSLHIVKSHFFITFFLSNAFSKFDRPSRLARKKVDLEYFGTLYLYYTSFFLHLQLTQQNKKWTKQYLLLFFRSIWCIILIEGWFTSLKLWRGRLFYVYKFCLYRRDARGHCWYQ